MPKITFDEAFYKLFEEVREIRAKDRNCPSANDGQDLKEILTRINDEDYFENDFKSVTMGLLFEDVSYAQVKGNLKQIVDMI